MDARGDVATKESVAKSNVDVDVRVLRGEEGSVVSLEVIMLEDAGGVTLEVDTERSVVFLESWEALELLGASVLGNNATGCLENSVQLSTMVLKQSAAN
jgi:hypothetical protein